MSYQAYKNTGGVFNFEHGSYEGYELVYVGKKTVPKGNVLNNFPISLITTISTRAQLIF